MSSVPKPPAELIAELPGEPAVPTEANESAVGAYIVALRDYGRTVANRFNALRTWASTPPSP